MIKDKMATAVNDVYSLAVMRRKKLGGHATPIIFSKNIYPKTFIKIVILPVLILYY